jgi:hypothetical protein
MLVRLTEQELETIDDRSCVPSSPVVLDIDRAEDTIGCGPEDMFTDVDSGTEFSDVDSLSNNTEQETRASDPLIDTSVPTDDFEDDLYCDDVLPGMTRAYVCARDPVTLKPVLAFKVLHQVPSNVYPDTYRWINPLSIEKDRPLVIWDLRCPLIALSLPDITNASNCSPLLILQTLYNILRSTKEFSDWDSDFWEDMKMLPLDCLVHLYDTFQDAIKKANGYVSTFNPVLSFCTGGRNNVSLLGSNQQAKCAIYYISLYLGKNKEVFCILWVYCMVLFIMLRSTRALPQTPR